MKVVIPVGDLHIGGGCKVLVNIANALHARGHDTEIVIPQTGTVKYDIDCKLTVVPELRKELIPYGDIVLPNFYTTFRPAFEAWPKQCVRLSLGFEPYWVPDKKAALWTYQQEVPIITISHWLDEQIHQHVKKRSKIVNLGVDPSVFSPTAAERMLSHEHTQNAKPAKVILYIARNPDDGYALKGFHDFQTAVQQVKNKYRGALEVHLICPEAIMSLPGIAHRIFTPKTEQEMVDLYRNADLFVSSSWFEAFALPPLEAMACGTPVVATNSGGLLDYCRHLENVYLTPPQNPDELAKGIVTVLSDEELAIRLVRGGSVAAKRLTKARFEHEMIQTLEGIHVDRLGNESA